jgi:general secretion pathway protein N
MPGSKKHWLSRLKRRSLIAALSLGALLANADLASAGDETVTNPVQLQPLQELNATHERPLFSPTRKPPPKVVAPVAEIRAEPPPPPPPPPSLVLLGIVSDGTDGRAAIRSGDKGAADKVLRVRAGDALSGWTVEKIEPRRVVLTQGERSADYLLFAAVGKKAADAARRKPVH